MTCLFDLDNYDCDGTTPDQCIEVLEKKFSSWLTPANDRERLPDCAAAIEGKNGPKHFRDRAAGIRTRFVDKKEGKQPEEKSPLFYKYLSDLNLNTWQSFLQKKGIQVNPFRLVLFLRDRWQEEINSIAGLNEDEAQARLQEVEKIMQWILDYYSSKKERLRHSMQKVANEISERQRAYKEKELKNKIEELRKNKKWRALADLLEEVDSHNHFGQFIDYLAEVGKETEDGYKWLIYRDRLVQFLAGVTANKSNHIGREFQQLEQDLYFLFSNLDRYGTLEDDRELNNKVNALFDDLLPMLREIRDPEERYRELVQLENQFEGILPSPTAQWETFKVTMREELTKLFDDRLKDLLAHTKDLDDIRVQVDALEEKAAGIGIEGLYTPIENVKTQLVNLTNFVEAQELYLAKDNPMNIRHYQAQLQELEENYRGIEEFVSGWAVCKHLKNTFNENSKIFRQTANINDEIDELVLEVGKESQKILHNDLSVDISQFAGKFDQIKKKVHSISKTKGKTIFLENLATLIADIKRILLEPNGKETLSPDRHPYIQPILELVRAGEVFRNAFEELLVENPDDPVQTIDQFLQIIAQYKGTPLLLVAGEDKQLVALVEQIMKTIEQRITAVLEPITRALEPFIPLVPEEKLKQFETRLTAIRTRIPGSEDDYSGYEEISLPFEQKLDELTDMVHIQRLLSRQKFAEVRK
ncbi:MAG: hypothetical protein GY757_42485 [bacterium]|nr:hypothetical protein [bacterium]